MSEKYNGWGNYETWCVNLWLSNEEGSCRHMEEMAREVWEAAEASRYLTRTEEAVRTLAERIKSDVEEGAPEVDGLYGDLLTTAIQRADFDEIALNFISDEGGGE